MKRITIKDIARELNLSVSTVSRALRDSWDISPETKKRVMDLAQQYQYKPNPIALSLLTSQSQDIGVIVPEIANPFFAVVIAGIEEVAFAQGYQVVIYQSHENYEREVQNVQHISNRRKDGLLVSMAMTTRDYTHFKTLHDQGFPIVFFDRVCEEIDTCTVQVDDFEGAYLATEHLIQQGCERIAHLMGPANLRLCQRRMQGFRAAMQAYNRPFDDSCVLSVPFNPQQSLEATRQLLTRPNRPDGIFAGSDTIALGAHAAISEAGLTMPHQVALVGFADLPIATMLNPPLSSVAQPAFEMGKTAASLLISMIKNPRAHVEPVSTILNTKLMVRKSSLRKKAPLADSVQSV